jgi:hypothetical protein
MGDKQQTKANNSIIGIPFTKDDPRINRDGRKPDTEQDKIIKKATKELIAEYKESLGECLPLIKPVIIAKALEGDMTAIKEIHDRVMDKSKQPTDITSGGETINQVLVKFIDANTKDNTNTQGV